MDSPKRFSDLGPGVQSGTINTRPLWTGLFLALLAATALLGCRRGAPASVLRSPDGTLTVDFGLRDSTLHYSVVAEGDTLVRPSPLGLSFRSKPSLFSNLQLTGVSHRSDTARWQPVWGTQGWVEKAYHEAEVRLRDPGSGRQLRVRFRAFNEGVAFRYVLPGPEEGGKSFRLTDEKTRFRFAGHPRGYVLRQGFGSNYEGNYRPMPLSDLTPDTLAALPLLVEADQRWMAVTEAALADYAGLYLRGSDGPNARLRAALAPGPDPTTRVKGRRPHTSPWRVLLVGERPGALIESSLVPLLNPPNRLASTDWIEPGQVLWPWWNGRRAAPDSIPAGTPSTALMKYYVDFAAAHDVPYLLIDAGWYSTESDAWEQPLQESVFTMEETRRDTYDVPAVIDYATKKGVDVLLWAHLHSIRDSLDRVFSRFADWGADGVKIDNYGGDHQQLVQTLRKAVRVAAEHELVVNYHGAYKPTGMHRTYPNFLTREGVLGLEYSKGSPRPTPKHNVTIPFTRMLAGPMDYTPGAFDLDGTPQSPKHVQTTRAQQIAMYVVYFSPLQMLVDAPAVYRAAPKQFQFVRSIPTTWAETRVLTGHPGDYIAVARRSGDRWFLGAMTDSTARTLEVQTDFLAPDTRYQVRIARDGPNVASNPEQVVLADTVVSAGDTLTLDLPPAGGQAWRFTPLGSTGASSSRKGSAPRR